MKVLVTGSGGFIGKAVAAELKLRDFEMIPFDRPEGDVRQMAVLLNAARDADAIINLAGALGTPELFGSEAFAIEVNIGGALNVFDAARHYSIPCVQIGTGHKGQPNPYAITKGCAEDLALARAQWQGEKIAVVRAYHAYGPGQLPGPPHGPAKYHKFFPSFACAALTGGTLDLCGGGKQLIDPVYVDEIASVLVSAVSGPYGHVIEAGTGRPITVAQVAEDIAMTATHRPDVHTVRRPARIGEPREATVVATVPACHLAWPYRVAETVEWYRSYLAGPRP